MTTTLTRQQLELVRMSAELRALGDCLPDDDGLLEEVADRLRRIGARLWDLVDEIGGEDEA